MDKAQVRDHKSHLKYLAQAEKLETLASFDLDLGQGHHAIGVDEAGRGPLAGPVVAAACLIGHHPDLVGLDDSKKLSQARRDQLYEQIKSHALAYGIGLVHQDRIDEINILNATKEAMADAIGQVLDQVAHMPHLKDLSLCLITDHVQIRGFEMPMHPIVKGDQKSLCVAAASILAKVTRDRWMCNVAMDYPQYHFDIHKGYGTPAHYAALNAYGPSDIHRKSFLKKWAAARE